MRNLTINWLAVLICGAAAQIIGFVWYGVLFSNKWMNLNGLTMEKIQGSASSVPYIFSFLVSLIQAAALAWLFTKLKIESGKEGAPTGLFIGFFFIILTLCIINQFSMRSIELAFIDGGNYAFSLGVFGWILGAWRKYA